MNEKAAQKYAQVLLDQNGHEKQFTVELSSRDFVAQVATALRCLGCEVRENEFRSVIEVFCPETPSAAELG